MKVTCFLVLSACLQVSAEGFGQNITLHVKNAPLAKVFREISRQSGYQVFANDRLLKGIGRVSADLQDVSLKAALDACFKDQPLSYVFVGKTVVIKQEENTAPAAPPVEVKGVIRDDKGNPLPGATIRVKGKEKAVVSDGQGAFTLAANPGDQLVISFIGYEDQVVTVTAQTDIRVAMKLASSKMNELIVVGYGTQKKASLTGAVSVASAKDFVDRPVTNVSNALQGKLSGVTVTTDNGQPGRDGGTINVRGIGTGLGGSPAVSGPMVVVDGIVASLGEVNPNDIESITVLKDASSAAIYGARASNGVILVTTKKGKKGSLSVAYDGYVGLQSITRKPDFLPSWQQASLYNEALVNEGGSPKWTDQDIQLFKDGSDRSGAHPNTDWLGLFYSQPGYQSSNNVSINGGDEKTRYMFSVGYFNQQGNVPETKYEKYNMRFNLNSQVSKKFGFNANVSYLYAPFNEPVSSYYPSFAQIIGLVNGIASTVPYKWQNGAYGYVSNGSPMAWLESGSFNKWQNYTFTGNIGLDYAPVTGLHLRPSFGYRLAMGQQQQFVSDIQYYKGGPEGTPLTPTKYQGPNNLTNTSDRTTYTLLQMLAEYEKALGQHHFKLLGGASKEYSIYNNASAYRQGFLNNAITQLNAAPADGQTAKGYANDWALQSVFGRFNYDWADKYLFEANIRYDGSSRFAPGKQWGAFPSFSAGWVISEESFFGNLKNSVNLLKLRGSWGRLGNQQISNYPAIATVSPGQVYSFNQSLVSGIAPTAGANTDIQWEKTETYGVGIDAALLQNRLNFSFDLFNKNTSNILMVLPIGAPYALSAPFQNAGAMTNKGFELNIGYSDNVGKVKYTLNGNVTYTKNSVTDLKGAGPFIGFGTFYDVNYPFYSLYGLQATGIYRTKEEVTGTAVINPVVSAGDIKYKDQNNDGKIDAKDRVYLGSYFPKYTFGLTATAAYKNFQLSLFFQGAAGVKSNASNLIGSIGGDSRKPTSLFLDRWTPQNPSAPLPRAWYRYTQNDPFINPSSFWIKDASYVRLKNIALSYSIPKSWIAKVHLTNMRIFYSGQNVLTLTKFYKGIDPEIGSRANPSSYPQVMVNTIGLNVTF
ncbi:TonB-dependent receptor [Chitinophaga eiseniae]|uniref:TonB-dependent receptor n=1 Tax=Chitinophaga eiseniae TaxID=634771 RepID=A0A847SMH1_9BACT|nr:TonB-dependent receptor [Chitinophaga eiseniae]NLR80425.1 TonB-dependent receptor [Chitinophaga eiseniae]